MQVRSRVSLTVPTMGWACHRETVFFARTADRLLRDVCLAIAEWLARTNDDGQACTESSRDHCQSATELVRVHARPRLAASWIHTAGAPRVRPAGEGSRRLAGEHSTELCECTVRPVCAEY